MTTAEFTSVPLVGKVTLVAAVKFKAAVKAPDVVSEPASEIATPPILLTVSAPPCAMAASPLTVTPETAVPVPVAYCAIAGPVALLTVPEPLLAGVAHVPSPRQKVVDVAPVPEFRFANRKVAGDVGGSPGRVLIEGCDTRGCKGAG